MTLLSMPLSSPRRSATSAEGGAPTVATRMRAILDRTSEQLATVDLSGMPDLVHELDRVRRELPAAAWWQLVADVVGPHRILAQLHQEPFARRAFEKPRGYSGDAPLLDLVYRDRPYSVELTRLGAALHAWMDRAPASVSVQERRYILAGEIDAIATRREGARVLSLACGHLREGQLSDAMRRGLVSELVALDQDAESLAVVEREQRDHHVVVKRASVRRFVAGGASLGEFDLAYSAGLYDYLSEADGVAVTAALFRSLRPGGRLLVANFAPELRDIAYMEAIMDWRLIYRNEAELARLAAAIPETSIASLTIFRDSGGNVVYMTIDRT